MSFEGFAVEYRILDFRTGPLFLLPLLFLFLSLYLMSEMASGWSLRVAGNVGPYAVSTLFLDQRCSLL